MLIDGILREGALGMQYLCEGELDDQRAQREIAQVISIGSTCAKY